MLYSIPVPNTVLLAGLPERIRKSLWLTKWPVWWGSRAHGRLPGKIPLQPSRNTPQGPTPALGAMLVINCWEMIMLAAFRAGVLTWTRIHSIYTAPGGPAWGSFLVSQLSFNNRIPYNVGAPASRPVVGDIVFFDGPAHVALAKGALDGMGRTQIFSFWPPPNTAFTAGGTLDDVKITTIEELNDYWVAAGRPAFVVEYTTPNW